MEQNITAYERPKAHSYHTAHLIAILAFMLGMTVERYLSDKKSKDRAMEQTETLLNQYEFKKTLPKE